MFGFIKNLISGIMKFITGLFPFKKKSNGYYLELKEDADTVATEKVAQTAKAAVDKVAQTAKAAAEKITATTEADADKAIENGKQSTQSVAAMQEAKNGTKAPARPAEVEMVQTASGVRVEPKSEKESAKAAKIIKEQPKETTFAPKYLLVPNTANGRRRPGANMNSYLEMARQVKTPKTGR
jgi:hypothetical protein